MTQAGHKSFNLLYVLKEAQLLGFFRILTEIFTVPPLDIEFITHTSNTEL